MVVPACRVVTVNLVHREKWDRRDQTDPMENLDPKAHRAIQPIKSKVSKDPKVQPDQSDQPAIKDRMAKMPIKVLQANQAASDHQARKEKMAMLVLPVLLENPVDLAAMLNIVLAPAEVNLVVLDLVPKAETPWLLVPVQLVPVPVQVLLPVLPVALVLLQLVVLLPLLPLLLLEEMEVVLLLQLPKPEELTMPRVPNLLQFLYHRPPLHRPLRLRPLKLDLRVAPLNRRLAPHNRQPFLRPLPVKLVRLLLLLHHRAVQLVVALHKLHPVQPPHPVALPRRRFHNHRQPLEELEELKAPEAIIRDERKLNVHIDQVIHLTKISPFNF